MNDTPEVQWTNKLPALVAGVVLIVAGLIASSRRATMTALVLMALGIAFVGYSLTIKNWCEVKNDKAWGSGAFSEMSFGGCLKAKGWLAF